MRCFFFFQAEDGIRDIGVTGVQTCALPIYGDPVAELLDLREEVAGEEDREPLAGELAHQRPDVAHAAWVQAVRRLVQDEKLWFPEERRRYRQPLLHPLRVRLYLILRPACQVHGLEHPLYRRGLVPAPVGGR